MNLGCAIKYKIRTYTLIRIAKKPFLGRHDFNWYKLQTERKYEQDFLNKGELVEKQVRPIHVYS